MLGIYRAEVIKLLLYDCRLNKSRPHKRKKGGQDAVIEINCELHIFRVKI
jgi:hypothetical protein